MKFLESLSDDTLFKVYAAIGDDMAWEAKLFNRGLELEEVFSSRWNAMNDVRIDIAVVCADRLNVGRLS